MIINFCPSFFTFAPKIPYCDYSILELSGFRDWSFQIGHLTSDLSELVNLARWSRLEIFKFKTSSGFGHLSSCLSTVDILTSLYLDKETFFDHEHDRVIFSKGHGSPAVYPILAKLGYFGKDELENYCKPNGILRLHSDYSIPGCFFVGGSLGNGIGFAAGLAIARPWQNFIVVLGDAELYEGSVWETLLFINHHKLKNIILIIDRNKFGILGPTEEMIKLESLADKFKSFGFKVSEIDGHNLVQLRNEFKEKPTEPHVIIANTVKGKGVSYMEDKYEYHTIIPSSTLDIEVGMRELS